MSIKLNSVDRLADAFLGIIVIAGLLIIAYSSCFIHPNAEDILVAQKSRDQGIFRAAINMLLSYDGRFATNILHGLGPLAFGWYEGFRLVPLFNFFFVALTFFFLLKQIFLRASFQKILKISILFVFTHVALAPTVAVQLYYYIGSLIYFLSFGFLFLWIAFFLLHLRSSGGIYFWAAAFFLIIANGMSEMFLLYNFAALCALALFIYHHRNEKEKFRALYALIIIFFGTVFFFVSSPGIAERLLDYSEDRAEFSRAQMFTHSISEFSVYVLIFFKKGLIAFSAIFFIALELSDERLLATFLPRKKIIPLTFLSIVIIYLSTFSYYFSIGSVGANADRIYNTVYFLLAAVFAIIGTVLFNSYRYKITPKKISALKMICVASFTLGLVVSENNFKKIIFDFQNGSIYSLHFQMQERLKKMEEVKESLGCKVVYFERLQNLPSTTWHHTDIEPHRKEYYWNRGYERFFYIDEVKFAGDTTGLFDRK